MTSAVLGDNLKQDIANLRLSKQAPALRYYLVINFLSGADGKYIDL